MYLTIKENLKDDETVPLSVAKDGGCVKLSFQKLFLVSWDSFGLLGTRLQT
jgi:hypothetical protein